MVEVLKVDNREETGSSRMRRLRAKGKIPAVLYGHGQDNMNLTLDEKELMAVINHSGHFVQLSGVVNDSALIKDIQWDHVNSSVVHVDLARVDAKEEVEMVLSVELRGSAKGLGQGGVVNQVTHEIEIRCPADVLPEKLELRIHDLEVGQSLRAKDIPLPEGATLLGSPDDVIVQCNLPMEMEEPPAAEGEPGEGAQPEVIGRKKDEEESDEES